MIQILTLIFAGVAAGASLFAAVAPFVRDWRKAQKSHGARLLTHGWSVGRGHLRCEISFEPEGYLSAGLVADLVSLTDGVTFASSAVPEIEVDEGERSPRLSLDLMPDAATGHYSAPFELYGPNSAGRVRITVRLRGSTGAFQSRIISRTRWIASQD